MTNRLTAELTNAFPNGNVDITDITSALSKIASLPAEIKNVVLGAFTNALDTVFLVAVPILVLGFIVALFLKEVRLRRSHDDAPPMMAE